MLLKLIVPLVSTSGCILIDRVANDVAYSFVKMPDGTYVFAGYTEYQGNRDVFIARVTINGSIVWSLRVGGAGTDEGRHVIRTQDGGLLVTGYTTSWGAGNADVYVLKLTASGQIQWARTIGGAYNDRGHAAVQTPDGGYLIVGETYSYYPGTIMNSDVYIIKLSSSGGLQWRKHYGGYYDDPVLHT